MAYKVGDTVRIVSSRANSTTVGWTGPMIDLLGQEATITYAEVDNGTNYYRIDLDDEEYWWADDCFDERVVHELPDLDPVPPETFQILFG